MLFDIFQRHIFDFGPRRAARASYALHVWDLFEAGGEGGLLKDLVAMKVTELKEELEVRDEGAFGKQGVPA